MVNIQEQVRATLAGDFWLSDYVILPNTVIYASPYTIVVDNDSLDITGWINQFVTDKSQTMFATQTMSDAPGYDSYMLIEVSTWPDIIKSSELALVRIVDNNQTEIWFGKDSISELLKTTDIHKLLSVEINDRLDFYLKGFHLV